MRAVTINSVETPISRFFLCTGLKALINAVDGVNGMRVVCLARLTPIPFGIQNAVFAISVLPRWKYVAASMIGLLPGQIIEAYIGSSLKNLGEYIKFPACYSEEEKDEEKEEQE